MGAPQQGMFPLVQTLYNNRPPTGFFYFPTWQSMMAFMERDNTLANFRGNEANSTVTVVTAAGTEHTSPDWDGTTEYATEKDEEKTFEAGSGKHVYTSYPFFHGKSVVKYETEDVINTWMKIVIETKKQEDNTFDFVISVGEKQKTVEDVSAKAIEDVKAWDTHFALKPAAAVYKNLVINAGQNGGTDSDGSTRALPRSIAKTWSNVGVPFAGYNDWINNPKTVYTVNY